MPFVIYSVTRELGSNRGQAFVKAVFEAVDLVVVGSKVVARALGMRDAH